MMKLVNLAPLLLVAACSAVGPDYERPDISVTQTFYGGDREAAAAVSDNAWWREYRDPLLEEMIARGLTQSLDVAAAEERIREAEANLRATGVAEAVDGSISASRTRSGGDGIATKNSTTVDLGASLVIDMFGGIRRARESAEANLAAARADWHKARLAWLAELVADYSDARYYQEVVALIRETIDSREQTVAITENQLNAGDATEYDVAEAQALLDAARADLPLYQAGFSATVFAIATLLNEPVEPIMSRMIKEAPQLTVSGEVSAGVPADLLRNRPDVRYYEGLLHAAVADVGVATANMLPSLTLSGDIAIGANADSWSFGPELSLPWLNQGLLSAQRDAKISAAKQAEIDWRSSVASAVEDVQVALSNLTYYRLRTAALEKAAESYDRALSLARENFRGGAITLLDLLDTDRSTVSAKINAASARNDAAKEWATLQIAIGTGAGVGESQDGAL